MLDLAFLAALNRLLAAAPWARDKLAPFSGKRAHLALGPLPVEFRIAPDGTLESLGSGAPDVEIILPLPTPLALLAGREALMKNARIGGAADFAEALGFVLRNLEWDAEEDLSRIVGDIAAHRIIKVAGEFAAGQADIARRLAENVAEYLRYEQPAGVGKTELTAFAGDIDALRRDADSLERRIASIEKSSVT
ncbi:MAG: hypothetical protein FJY34_00510 [Betaproteobacteria bacterium]|nr:hypothetical protein [Betaproteobacteria bacterium]